MDTFVSPAWPKLKEAVDGLGNALLKYVIDTHWHFKRFVRKIYLSSLA